jgi:hypothetical protein
MIKSDDQFSQEETHKRFVAALRGARIAGPQHKSVTPKRKRKQRKKKKPSTA